MAKKKKGGKRDGAGRPKGSTGTKADAKRDGFAKALQSNDVLRKAYPKAKSADDLVVALLVGNAMSNNGRAAERLADQLWGRPRFQVEVGGDPEGMPITHALDFRASFANGDAALASPVPVSGKVSK